MNVLEKVYQKKSECCGCAKCVYECPVNAIKMEEDELGYLYPTIDQNLCIDCNKCIKSCSFIDEHEFNLPKRTYAAVRNDKLKLLESSSGGVFAAVAEGVLNDGGAVCGAIIDTDLTVKHTIISSEEQLIHLLGSKYVQSDISSLFEVLPEFLKKGKVLFCGTPCQVDAIAKSCRNTNNLITMELICHGVPNNHMFKSYVNDLGYKDIKYFKFRDKEQGWSFNSKLCTSGSQVKIPHRMSSYMSYFLDGEIYRESCYQCPYATDKRCADVTIGDFWGVVRKRPDLGKLLDVDKGVSCLLVNTHKGEKVLESINLSKYEVEYSDIKEGNEPLNHPSVYTEKRKVLLNIWKEYKSWEMINNYWRSHDYKFIYLLWSKLPIKIRQSIRILLKKR